MKQAIESELNNPHYNFEGGQRHAAEVDYNDFRAELVADLKTAGVHIPERKAPVSIKKLLGSLLSA